jgi:hypothetical protein
MLALLSEAVCILYRQMLGEYMKVGCDHFKLLYSHCYRICIVGSHNGRIKNTSFSYVWLLYVNNL